MKGDRNTELLFIKYTWKYRTQIVVKISHLYRCRGWGCILSYGNKDEPASNKESSRFTTPWRCLNFNLICLVYVTLQLLKSWFLFGTFISATNPNAVSIFTAAQVMLDPVVPLSKHKTIYSVGYEPQTFTANIWVINPPAEAMISIDSYIKGLSALNLPQQRWRG